MWSADILVKYLITCMYLIAFLCAQNILQNSDLLNRMIIMHFSLNLRILSEFRGRDNFDVKVPLAYFTFSFRILTSHACDKNFDVSLRLAYKVTKMCASRILTSRTRENLDVKPLIRARV